ncbi:hypothetical protein PXK58_19435 [Phaeobacter gallaeciensis]|uniref:hypothetical protein n=1 Tax=Phaeobacter gallaeciensis TaxID=60890 RepID=UPI002380BF41|nr:hypothetical protein [Phaeobacter gallaeciensis]MDE4276534.1 hypothetical protein [Phaeobacter gallaeciensis]MDE4301725.1 hypothetical protein [Phaeobacter gallaeciensis]MDE5186878.1 hypothetical protein [Phaeobacter gallaeciensis]
MDTIRQTSPANAVQAGPLAHYGKLSDWLDRRSNSINPGPIRDLLRDHIVKYSAVEPGNTVLGVEITERRFHTLYGLSAAVGIKRPRPARLLKKLGEIPAVTTEIEGGKMVFEAVTTVSMIEAFQTAIPFAISPNISAQRNGRLKFSLGGIVLPLILSTERGWVRHVFFGRSHLDELLAKIAGSPTTPVSGEGDLHPIFYACQRGADRFEYLFSEILNGNIPAFRHPRKQGIGLLLVDVVPLVFAKNAASPTPANFEMEPASHGFSFSISGCSQDLAPILAASLLRGRKGVK